MAVEYKQMKEPIIRVVKRGDLSSRDGLLLHGAAFLLALTAGGIFILLVGHNPFVIYGAIIGGAVRSGMAIQATVKIIIPLLIVSLGITLAFKMQFWNIGAEGQMIMGAASASYFALFHSNWPGFLLIPVMIGAGIVGGGLWGLIPAFFKARYNTNETLFTLMLNYVALHIISFLRDGPWRDPANPGFSKIASFGAGAHLPKLLGVHLGWVFALMILVLTAVYIKYSKQGYELQVVGKSHGTAGYAGMKVSRILLRTMFISGGVCGIAGMAQATGSDLTLAAGVAGGVGFTAIIVAWLGNLSPINILVISVLFGILEKGGSVIQSSYGISTDCAAVLQGIILFFILGCEFFGRFRLVTRGKKTEVQADGSIG